MEDIPPAKHQQNPPILGFGTTQPEALFFFFNILFTFVDFQTVTCKVYNNVAKPLTVGNYLYLMSNCNLSWFVE